MVAQNRVPAPAPLSCPACGGRVELRGFAHTRNAVCLQCCSIIDTSTASLKIVQQFDERLRERPLIPLGTRGKLHGKTWEAIGFQVRAINVEGIQYSWHEYLLFNPFAGFRYLTQYDGHWNDVATVHALPAFTTLRGRKAVAFGGRTYAHFQNCSAETLFVMGEFPWAVRVKDCCTVDDYTSPPFVLSSEQDGQEINWSQGVYMTGTEVWQAFGLKGEPPEVKGVYSNQPNPHKEQARRSWRTFVILVLLWGVTLAAYLFTCANQEVYRRSFHFVQNSPGEHSFVTEPFSLAGDGNVKIEVRTDLDNNWAYFNMALLREDGTQGFDFGREVSYYHGRDSDGSWSEGSRSDSALLARIPAGTYYLRIEPDMDPQASAQAASGTTMNYELRVRRDVPRFWLFVLALPLLLISPVMHSFRAISFETVRWSESDYGTPIGSSGDDDE